MWVRALVDCDLAACGGKASGLARLIAAGLPVPDGFLIETAAFHHVVGALGPLAEAGHRLEQAAKRIAEGELAGELVREVEARAARLGTLAVRSSAALEDRATGAAAGVFSSVVGVPPSEVWPAIRAVWTSALTSLAAAYGKQHAPAIAVIVQRYLAGERVTVYTRPPGAPAGAQVWVQRGGRLDKLARSTDDPIVVLALRAEQAIQARDGADVELVVEREAVWLVQARPIVHPVVHARRPPPPAVLAPLVEDGRTWTWDVAHNPDPLSPAQVGLVERVERADIAPWSLRVCAGYLYVAPREEPVVPPVSTRRELEDRAAQLDARLAALALEARVPLATALERYLAFYRIWACELVPLIRAARRELSPELLLGARPSAVELTLLGAARGELDADAVVRRLGVMSPAWDVAVPTFAEQPALLHAAVARACIAIETVRSEEPVSTPASAATDLARGAADLAERDDVWFARAQWQVRRAILDRARELGLDPVDAFWIPLDELATATTVIDVNDAHRRAGAARAAAGRTMGWEMPLVIGGPATAPRDDRPPLVGIGSGGRASGRVVRLASLASAVTVGPTDVVVTRAVTPALAVIVVGCAAIVSESGGLLDHGAAMARELGIPCIVGCRDAWSRLSDGMLVTIDGDAGTVTC